MDCSSDFLPMVLIFFPPVFFPKDPSVSNNSTSKKKSESTVCTLVRDVNKHDAGASSPLLLRDVTCEDDKGKIMEDVMRTYVRQQEKLNSILQKKQQLQMVTVLSSSHCSRSIFL